MVLRHVLGSVFVSLVFLIPVYLPQYAFAACCVCNNGAVTSSPRGCNNCGCGDAPKTIQCIKNIDINKGEVTFEDKATHEQTTMEYVEGALKNAKVGDCGTIKSKQFEITECTGFTVLQSNQQQ